MNVAHYLRDRQYGVKGLGRKPKQKVIEDFVEDRLTECYTNKPCSVSGHCRSTFIMDFSPDGTKVASTHGDHTVRVSDISTGKCLRTLRGHPRTPWCLAYHPSSNHILASGCLGGQVRIWDLYGCGCEIWQTENNKVIAAVTFHPTDHVLVIAAGHTLYFWDWSKPEPFAQCSTTHEYERIRWVKFDSVGHYLYTGICNNTTIHRDEVPDVLADTRQHETQRDTRISLEDIPDPPASGTVTSIYNNLVNSYRQYQRRQLMPHRVYGVPPASLANRHRRLGNRPRLGLSARSESSSSITSSATVRTGSSSVSSAASGRRCTCRPGPSSRRPRRLMLPQWQNVFEQTEICLRCTASTEAINNARANSDQSDPFEVLDRNTTSAVNREHVSGEQASGALPTLSSVWPGIPTRIPVSDPLEYSLADSSGVSDFSSLQADVTSSLNSDRPGGPSAATSVSLTGNSSSHSMDTTDTDVLSGSRPELDDDEEMPRLQELPEWLYGSIPIESLPDFTSMSSSAMSERHSEFGLHEVEEPHISELVTINNPESSSNVQDSSDEIVTVTTGSDVMQTESDTIHERTNVSNAVDAVVNNNGDLNTMNRRDVTTCEGNSLTLESLAAATSTRCGLPVSTAQAGSSSNRMDAHHSQHHRSGLQGATKPASVSTSPQSKPFSSIRDRLQSTVALCSVTDSIMSSRMVTSLQSGTIPVVTVISATDNSVLSSSVQSTSSTNLNTRLSSNAQLPRCSQNPHISPSGAQSSTEQGTVWTQELTSATSDSIVGANNTIRNPDTVNEPGESVNQSNSVDLETVDQSNPLESPTTSTIHVEMNNDPEIFTTLEHHPTNSLDHVLRCCPTMFRDSDLRRFGFEHSSNRNNSTNVAESPLDAQHNSVPSASHSRDQASSDTENELSSHLPQSGAYFMPIPENSLRTHSSSSSTRSVSSPSEVRLPRQGSSSTDSSAGQSSRSNSSAQDRGNNNVEVVVDQNDNYTTRAVRDPMQILQEISIRNNDPNNNSIHILQPNVQPTMLNSLSTSVTQSTAVTRQSEISTVRRSEGQDAVDPHQHYVALRNNFVSMTDQIEREMSALNRRINALRDSFNESLVALHQDRHRYSQFGNTARSEVNGSLSAGSGVMRDSLDAIEMGQRTTGEFDTMNSDDDSSDSDGSPGGASTASLFSHPPTLLEPTLGALTTASSFTQPATLLETSLRSHTRSRQLESNLYQRSTRFLGSDDPLPAPDTTQVSPPSRGNTSNWRLLHRHFLHPHYSNNILDEAINRPNNAIQSAISRAISGAFVGTAMANNMINQTHRIQGWDFSKCRLPNLADCDENVIVLHCKLHNSASCDIARTDTLLATFVPSPQGFPEDNILAVYSLRASNRGQCLYTKSFGPNAISISISPSNQHVLVGLAAKRLSWVFTSKQLVAQIYKLEKQFEGESSMKHVRDVKHSCNLDVRTHVSGNSARWLPQSGQGLVYGTNRGDLHLCTPGTRIMTSKTDFRNRNIRFMMSDEPGPSWTYSPHRVSASTQTQGQARDVSQSAGTQTDLDGNLLV